MEQEQRLNVVFCNFNKSPSVAETEGETILRNSICKWLKATFLRGNFRVVRTKMYLNDVIANSIEFIEICKKLNNNVESLYLADNENFVKARRCQEPL